MRSDYYDYDAPVSEPYQSPPYIPQYGMLNIESVADQSIGGDGDYFGLPYVPDRQIEVNPRDDEGQYFGLPYVPVVSRVGPSASVMPRGPASLFGIPAGSLFAPRSAGRSTYRGRVPYQRSFSVQMQEKLRRRRRGR